MDIEAEVKKILKKACQFNNEHPGCSTLDDGECLQADCCLIGEQADEICQLFELPEPPPLLSDEKIEDAVRRYSVLGDHMINKYKAVAQAQWDIWNEWRIKS